MALSTALAAVWPRPHKEASLIVQPTSVRRSTSPTTASPRAKLAGITLAARLVGKEARQPAQDVTQVAPLIEDHDHARAKRQPGGAQVLEGHAHIQFGGGGKGARRAAEQHSLQGVSVADAAGQLLEQRTQGDAERHLVHAGTRHITRDAKQLGAGRLRRAELAVFPCSVQDHIRHVAQGLDVVNHRRLAKQAMRGREGRLEARETTLALDGFK
jgi:hypothetical protein